MLTIIESGSKAWALAAADGDLHVYSREGADQWAEVLLSDDSEQIDQDGSSILEALYEQYAATEDGQSAPDEADQEQPEDEAELLEDEDGLEDEAELIEEEDEPELLEDEDEPEDEAEPPTDDDEEEEAADEDEEPSGEEKKPRGSRARTRSKKQ